MDLNFSRTVEVDRTGTNFLKEGEAAEGLRTKKGRERAGWHVF